MQKVSASNNIKERRARSRKTNFRNYRVEIKLIGAPIYQFRVTDISLDGAGLIVKEDSGFLKLIKVDQIVEAEFISPDGKPPCGNYRTKIIHISKPDKGKNEGHCLIGLSILEKIEHLQD